MIAKLWTERRTDNSGLPAKRLCLETEDGQTINLHLGSTECKALSAALLPHGRDLVLEYGHVIDTPTPASTSANPEFPARDYRLD